MKKFLAILMAILMVLSMATVAMAEDEFSTPSFKKKLHIVNEGTTAPATTFSFTASFDHFEDGSGNTVSGVTGPSLTLGDAVFSATSTDAEANVAISNDTAFPRVGVYFYKIAETATSVAGINNHSKNMLLKITVTNAANGGFAETYAFYADSTEGKTKDEVVTNTYSAGKLEIKKTVSGRLGDLNQYFEFKVKLEGEEGKDYASSFKISGGTYYDNPATISKDAEISIWLKNGETVTIANLPYGMSYTVTEVGTNENNKNGNYTVTKSDDGNGKILKATSTVAFNNDYDGNPDTGVALDTLPYVLVLALAGAGLVLMIARKRRVQD